MRRLLVIISCFCLHIQWGMAQRGAQTGIIFYHLNTAHGLSDNYIYDLCVDNTGNLWVGSGEGLNVFNGKTITKFFKADYPQMQSDFTRQLICDDRNRIWVLCADGYLSMVDESRNFHKVVLYDTKRIPVQQVLRSKSLGIVLIAGNDFYVANPVYKKNSTDSLGLQHFKKLTITGLAPGQLLRINQAKSIGDDEYILATTTGINRVDLITRKFEASYPYSNVNLLTQWKGNEFLVYDRAKNRCFSIDLLNGNIIYPFDSIHDQHGRSFTAFINRALLQDQKLWLSSGDQGLFMLDMASGKLHNFRHAAADPTTIVNNSPSVIVPGNAGWIFIGNTPNGVSYFKSNAVIGQQLVFTDNRGNGYDGFINSIATKDNDNYYIGVADNLIRWKRSTNVSHFIGDENGENAIFAKYGANFITFDNQQRVWVASVNAGITVLDANNRIIKRITQDTASSNGLPSNFVRHMIIDPTGKFMWASTRSGVCRIDLKTFVVDQFAGSPLSELKKVYCQRTWFMSADDVWVATEGKGAWHLNLSTNALEKIKPSEYGASDNVFCFNRDQEGNIYIGTQGGLLILLHNGKKKVITMNDGLLHNRVEALLLDKRNRMWMGNDVGLSCFSIADTSLKVFDERYGLSIQGFRLNSYHQNNDDELVWGTESGLQYFYPDSLWGQTINLQPSINRVESRDITANTPEPSEFHLSATDNSVTFYFSSIDYSKHLRTFYQYKLEGLDEDWIKVTDQNFVRYSSLPTGRTFIFKVRASNDNKDWEEAGNPVTIHIASPTLQKTWFKLLGVFVGGLLIWLVFRYYRARQQRQREVLETEAVINYFASRINTHQKTDNILWDVARNCISKLGFEDCVIYLVDEERNVLVQKAAYGPKMERDLTIYQPIEIPYGRGIVGSVAMSGKPILVSNTEQDSRYIADDARRNSELAVPLIVDGKVIGVIDSENSRKNFFTQNHLNILSTIAVLCANQIQRARAEEDKHKARIEVLENKQKVTESRLQSLRLQMNPHFLFNALNSIQQMILANEEMVATRYLSRFSKLLRTILIHSDKEQVSLKEELEILQLYVELESVRFKDSFNYSIECDDEIDKDEVKVPTLLVQPFVENAIWHGLMHKEGERKLKVSFFEKEDHLHCIVEDNGVGRKRSAETKLASAQGQKHTSKGIQVSLERLNAMHTSNGTKGSLKITDLENGNGEALGTRVEITFPIQTN